MRTLSISLVGLLSALGLALGCGQSTEEPGSNGASGQATAGSAMGGRGGAGSGGSSSSAGENSVGATGGVGGIVGTGSAGTANATGGASGSAAGGASGGSTGSAGGDSGGLVDCDPNKILCKSVAPQCAANEVPSVAGSCYGACVKIDRCACATAAQCPDPDQYACWGQKHCGPFVE